MMVCTEPLPNVSVPTRKARSRSCSAPAVHQHHDRIVALVAVALRLPLRAADAVAALGRNDHAFVEPQIGDLHRLLEQTARVVAQIEDQAADLAAGLLACLVELAAHERLGTLGELTQAQVHEAL